MGLPDIKVTDFAREGKFQGCRESEITDLYHGLKQSIYDYNTEVINAINQSWDSDDASIQRPLAARNLIDSSAYIEGRKPWCRVEGSTRNQSESYSPITAAL